MARYFTKQQIEEIARRLTTESVRDTDFDDATAITGDEYVPVVQDGLNRKVTMEDFVHQVTNNLIVIPEGEVALYGETGSSTTGGMTQKAITDAINEMADASEIEAEISALSDSVDTRIGNLSDSVDTRIDALSEEVDGKLDADTILDALEKMTTEEVVDLLDL